MRNVRTAAGPPAGRLHWIVLAMIAALFAVHLHHAAVIHLNPDEALHYQIAHQPTVRDAYIANQTNAHPPLLALALHYWMKLSTAEWFLRLIPLAAYCGMIWCAFRWGTLALGPEAGVTLAVLLAFAPPIYDLATEIRHYLLALCFATAALYFVERGFAGREVRYIVLASAMLYLAILSHYSALWFTIGFGVYSLYRVWGRELPRPAVIAWAVGQAGAALLYGVLYITHVSKLRGAGITQDAHQGWLRSMYRADGDNTIRFLVDNTARLYTYLFASKSAGVLGCLLVITGVWFLIAAKSARATALLLAAAAAFAACLIAAANGLYPYGGSRHSVLLILWICAAISAAVGVWLRERILLVGALLPVMVTLWRANAVVEPYVYSAAEQRRGFPVDAMAYLESRVSPRGLVFTDYQSSLLLCYYYAPDKYCADSGGRHFFNYDLGRIRVAVSRRWSLDATGFVEELKALKREYQLERGAEVWVFDGGWGSPVNRMIEVQYSGSALPGVREFGEHMSVFRIPN